MKDYGLDIPEREMRPLFSNRVGEKLTGTGITYILKNYVNAARLSNKDLMPDTLSPHSFRHSKAIHLLQSGINLVHIRDSLGHKSI